MTSLLSEHLNWINENKINEDDDDDNNNNNPFILKALSFYPKGYPFMCHLCRNRSIKLPT